MADELQKTAQADDQVSVVNIPTCHKLRKLLWLRQLQRKSHLRFFSRVLSSYKEESTRVADLVYNEKKAVEELKVLVREALDKHEFFGSAIPPQQQEPKEEEAETETVAVETKEQYPKKESINRVESGDTEGKVAPTAGSDSVEDDGAKTVEAIEDTSKADAVSEDQVKDANKVLPQEISIWGIPLLADERNDVILLKFLRTRDFKMKEAFTTLQNTIRWRKQFGIHELVEQDSAASHDPKTFKSKSGVTPGCYRSNRKSEEFVRSAVIAYDACVRLCLHAWARDCMEALMFLENECALLRYTFGLQQVLLQSDEELMEKRSSELTNEAAAPEPKKMVGKMKVQVRKVKTTLDPPTGCSMSSLSAPEIKLETIWNQLSNFKPVPLRCAPSSRCYRLKIDVPTLSFGSFSSAMIAFNGLCRFT
ncbi:hypothetical protein F3Y22_tig00110319pilonHSYRG00486 [Hibiscus syriacus]|uniref:CRAL/TRIO N-terminal domain-containing protein n=1 Tax=Hibiscus syriacus TaxID=106335 RepID=A0A6A3B2A3_HIBSY|nr:hypothetical protein F3Y22_tig00110319pilonHSYRG00486 [Hibiscus syriacus]